MSEAKVGTMPHRRARGTGGNARPTGGAILAKTSKTTDQKISATAWQHQFTIFMGDLRERGWPAAFVLDQGRLRAPGLIDSESDEPLATNDNEFLGWIA